jgi:hypothetical protein
MNDAVSSAVSSYLSARGNPPGPGEGVTIARTITNELDSARFDPLLVRTVARNTGKVLDGLIAKVDGMVSFAVSVWSSSEPKSWTDGTLQLVRDFTATSLIGPHPTPAQTINSQLVGCLYHCWYNLQFVQTEFPGKVWEILQPSITVSGITKPFLS